MLSHHNGVFAHGSKTGSVFVSQRLAPTAFSLQRTKNLLFLVTAFVFNIKIVYPKSIFRGAIFPTEEAYGR